MLADLLAGMRDSDGRILIDGFYEAARPITQRERELLETVPDPDEQLRSDLSLGWSEAGNARLAERIMMPAVNIKGIRCGEVGAKSKNAIPTEATASVGIRLVPDLTPEKARALVEAHVVAKGYHIVYSEPDHDTRVQHGRIARLRWGSGYPPARTSVDLPASQAVIDLVGAAASEPIVVMPTLGGSIPMYLFAEKFRAPVIGLPMANHDNNQHAPDENLRLQNLWDSIEINAAIMARLGHEWE
jgi:acetylornithine deacetylase/succinyl-diaminopimelate desuccinylase-like protein